MRQGSAQPIWNRRSDRTVVSSRSHTGLGHNLLFLFLDFEIEKHSNTRKVLWKWHERFLELLDPSIFLSSPMNMYFLMVMMQTTLVVMFQVVLDLSHHERKCGGSPCFWSCPYLHRPPCNFYHGLFLFTQDYLHHLGLTRRGLGPNAGCLIFSLVICCPSGM